MGEWRGGSLLDHLVATARAVGVDETFVVIGPEQEAVMARADLGRCVVVLDDDWPEGAASAIRAGLDTMWRSPGLEAAVIFDVAVPGGGEDVPVRLIAAHGRRGKPVTIGKYRYAREMPVVVGRSLWPRLMGLEGPLDLVAFLDAHEDWVDEVWIDRLPPLRVATPDDLTAALSRR